MLIPSFQSWIKYCIVPGECALMHLVWQWSIINCFLRTAFQPVIHLSNRNLILSVFPYHKWLIWRKEDYHGSRHAWKVCLATGVTVTCTWLQLKYKISYLLTNLGRKDFDGLCLSSIESRSATVASHIHWEIWSSCKLSRPENTDAVLYYAHSHYFQNTDEDFLYYGEILYGRTL